MLFVSEIRIAGNNSEKVWNSIKDDIIDNSGRIVCNKLYYEVINVFNKYFVNVRKNIKIKIKSSN